MTGGLFKWLVLGAVFWARAQPTPIERARTEYLQRRALAEETLAELEHYADDGIANADALADILRALIESAQVLFERGMTEGAVRFVDQANRELSQVDRDAIARELG